MDTPFDQDAARRTEDRPAQGTAPVEAADGGSEPRPDPVGRALDGRDELDGHGPGKGGVRTGATWEPTADATVEPVKEQADDDQRQHDRVGTEPPTMPVPIVPDLSAAIVPAAPIIPPAPVVPAEPVASPAPTTPPAPMIPTAPSSAGPAPSQGGRPPPKPVGAADGWTSHLTQLTRWPAPVRARPGHRLYSLGMLFVLAVTVGVLAAGTLLVVVFVTVGALGHGS